MTSVIFTFTLSAMLGYALFAGTSGYLNPFLRPTSSQAFSTKQISLIIGIGAAFIIFFALRWLLSFMPADFARLSAITLLICPTLCVIAFLDYRHRQKSMVPEHPVEANSLPVSEELTRTQADETHTNTSHTTTPSPLTDTPETVEDSVSATESSIAVGENDTMSTGEEVACAVSTEACHEISHSENSALWPPNKVLDTTPSAETTLSIDTEEHLCVTRKALSVLEAESVETKEFYARLLKEIKGKLARSIKESKALKSHVANERARTLKALNTIARLKNKQVQFKQQIHKSTAARAKALSTANKTIGFARQSLQIRARLESELNDMRSRQTGQEKTINDLSRSLEREKRINQAEVEAMAKQLILREKRASAKLARAQVVRGVENNLSTRLVRKVAKARSSSTDEK